jgi:PAS domain S-box-containing protein
MQHDSELSADQVSRAAIPTVGGTARGGDANDMAANLAARRSEARLQLALRSGDIGIWEWTIGSGEVTWSPEACEIVGATGLATTSIKMFESLVDDADRPRLAAAIESALTGETRFSVEFRIHRLSDGVTRWLVNSGDVTRDAAGKSVSMIGVVRDITVRKELEAMLQRSRDAALRRASDVLSWFEKSPAILWVARDPECRVVIGNRAAEELLGVLSGSNMAAADGASGRMGDLSVWQEGRQLEPQDTPRPMRQVDLL